MKNIRHSVVAGTFYPNNPKHLEDLMEQYLKQAPLPKEPPEKILGIISPHAGYIFSGQCAAHGFQALSKKKFDLAVVLAPSHQAGGFHYSVGDYDKYQTPLGEIDVDNKLTKELLKDSKFVFQHVAHSTEHSLEVQLPFLQAINPETKILPILIGNQSDENSEYLSKKLISLLSGKLDDTVFIISSDLSHFHDSSTAEYLDQKLITAIESLDIDQLWKLIRTNEAEACGFGGILTAMYLAKHLNYNKAKTLCYTHSGETGGDYSQVVGYLSALLYKTG